LDDLLLVPSSPSKKVKFNPEIKEMEDTSAHRRGLEVIRIEVRRAIEGHQRGDSEAYDMIKDIFAGRNEREGCSKDRTETKTYLLALTSHAALLSKGCSGLVKAVLACDWMGRDESFVKIYLQFLGNLASAQGGYVGMVLGMLVDYFFGGKNAHNKNPRF
jgi:RNA polymerase I-specific transcription initiation factor RRN3